MRAWTGLTLLTLTACSTPSEDDTTSLTNGVITLTNGPTSSQGSTTDVDSATSADGTTGVFTSSGTAADDSTGSDVTFDVGTLPDAGGPGPGPIIPENCGQAATAETTVGCLFFSVDLDQAGPELGGTETDQFAVGVSNVQNLQVANVTVERKVGGVWQTVEGPVAIDPLDLYAFELPDLHQNGSGLLTGGAYRVTSDVPVIAYQFNPLVAAAASSDASMLYPVTSWDTIGHVVQWASGAGNPYVTIAAAFDGTQVQIEPTVATAAGAGVPAGGPGMPVNVVLDEGDIVELRASANGSDITGTVVTSNADHPVAVFAGHECANIPGAVIACDHIEEQMAGLRLWGTTFVASRVMPRQSPPEGSAWHIYASEDGTQVDITAPAGVTGLPVTPLVLDRGERLELMVGGTAAAPGDFLVETSRPAAVVNYVTGRGNLSGSTQGDPAQVQLSPVEQFLPRYVVLVPSAWPEDFLVLTRPAGTTITLDGVAVPDADFSPVAGGYEVARVLVSDGVHSLDGTQPFSVVVVGYGFANSYAYLGGASTGEINPTPAR